MRPSFLRIVTGVLAAGVLLACSGDKSTGPGGSSQEGGPYEGTWALSWGTVTGDAATCRLPSMILVLHQFGDSVAGTYSSHGDLGCLRSGLFYTATPGSGRTGGHLVGDSLPFSFSLPLFTTDASAHDSTLSGVLNWLVVFTNVQTSYSVLSGPWTARRIPPPASQDSPADIELYPDLPIVIGGDSGQIIDTVRSASGQVIPAAPVTFSTSNAATATVGPTGVIHGQGGGLTLFNIIARSGDAYVDAVGVNIPAPQRLKVTPASLAMNREHSAQLTVQILDSLSVPITYVTPTYSVQPAGIVTVSSTGRVSAADTLGAAIVTVRAGNVTATVPVAVVAVAVGLQASPTSGVIIPHDSLQLTATVTDSGGFPVPGAVITFASSDPSVLSVSSSGLLRSVGPDGFADITMSHGAQSAAGHFVVWPGHVPSIIATSHTGGAPFSMAVSPSGAMYSGGAAVYRGDLPAYGFTVQSSLGGSVKSIAFDSSGHRAFFASYGSKYIDVIDADSDRIVDSVDVSQSVGPGQGVVSVALSSDGSRLFVGAGTFLVSYDAGSLAFVDSVGVGGSSVAHFSFDPAQSRGYASVTGGVEEFDENTLQRLRTWSVPNAQGTAVAPDGSELYVAVADSGIRIIDLASGQFESPVQLPGLYDLKVLPGPDLIVADGSAGYVYVLDRTTRLLLASLPAGGTPRRMAVDPSGQLIIEANEGGWVDFIK
ncbi:MAG: YncE family protein [Gemmatimonadales bacterium]